MKGKIIIYIFLAIVTFFSTFLIGYSNNKETPLLLYKVYSDGKSLGYIESEEKFLDYVNEKELEIKKLYEIDKLYFPDGIEIREEFTFSAEIISNEEMYEKITSENNIAIEAYEITIKPLVEGGTTKKIYTMDIDYFDIGLENTIKVFSGTDEYLKFNLGEQEEILEYGEEIEDIYIKEVENNLISYQKKKVSIDNLIITSAVDMSKYLLYGTLEEQEKYIVKEGDNLTSIAYNNNLSPEEFLIANVKFNSMDNLITPNEEVFIGLIDPQITVVVEKYVIEQKNVTYKTDIIYDANLLKGFDYYKTNGENGLNKVYEKVRYENGYISNLQIESTEILKPAINAVLVKGQKIVPSVGDPNNWSWPTAKPYIITSPYGPRWGSFHAAIDIVGGSGYGSPIYAANNGTIVYANYAYTGGYQIAINHNNGYYTYYCHMSKLLVSKGDVVASGTEIGKMGNTGHSSRDGSRVGTHLHFGVWLGMPYGGGSVSVSPLTLY